VVRVAGPIVNGSGHDLTRTATRSVDTGCAGENVGAPNPVHVSSAAAVEAKLPVIAPNATARENARSDRFMALPEAMISNRQPNHGTRRICVRPALTAPDCMEGTLTKSEAGRSSTSCADRRSSAADNRCGFRQHAAGYGAAQPLQAVVLRRVLCRAYRRRKPACAPSSRP